MDQLVAAAGFRKIDQRIDEFGHLHRRAGGAGVMGLRIWIT
jgi:hypothetical protein